MITIRNKEEMEKYELTLEQIHNIIEAYKLGKFCQDNCYGCCGDSFAQTHCKDCNPKLEEHLKNLEDK